MVLKVGAIRGPRETVGGTVKVGLWAGGGCTQWTDTPELRRGNAKYGLCFSSVGTGRGSRKTSGIGR